MKLGILFSSGKDSTFTTYYYRNQSWDVACLLCLLPKNMDSHMFQNPFKELATAEAEALGLPIIFQETAGEEEKELNDLKTLLEAGKKHYGLEGVAVGALASDYQHVRINHICEELSLKTYAPLWHKQQAAHMRELINGGFDVRITRIAAMGLDKSWLGRKLTLKEVEKLEKLQETIGFHPAGEGGEFETIVLDGPCFKHPISIEYDIQMESKERGELTITKVN